MGKKGRSKQPLPPLKTTTDCKKAIVAYNKGDYNRALRAIRNCQSSYGDCAVYHHAEAVIHYNLAMENQDDTDIVSKHINAAANSARQASSLFPSSTILFHFLACTLYDLACYNQDHDAVIERCIRALKIKDPKDPESDSFVFKDLSQEMETEELKQDIRELIQRCETKKKWVWNDSETRLGEVEKRAREAENRIKLFRKSSNNKFESRRKKNKSVVNGDKEQKVKTFWNSEMSAYEKRNLFEVRIEELKAHLGSSEDQKVMDLLLEAIDFYKRCKSWKFWDCCVKFVDWKTYTEHLYDSHGWKIHPDFLSDLPQPVDKNSVEVIMKGDWKPVDTEEAIKIMDNQFRLDLYTNESCTSAEEILHDLKACSSEDVPVVINRENMVKHLLFGSRTDKNESHIAAIDDLKLPLCDNRERAEHLERVCNFFQSLLRCNCLMQFHVDWMIEYTIGVLKEKTLDSELWNRVPKTLKLVFLLDFSQLEEILHYLKYISKCYLLSENPKMGYFMDGQLTGNQAFDLREKVVLSEDFSCLITVACDGPAVTSANSFHGDGVLPGNDETLSWLYMGHWIREALELWERLRDSQKGQTLLFFQVFEVEHAQLEKMRKIKLDHLEKLGAAQMIESIYLEEVERRKQDPHYVAETFESLLRKRHKELIESNDKAKTAFQLELDFILIILEGSVVVLAYQFEKDSRMQENLNISDYCVQKNIDDCVTQLKRELQVDQKTMMRTIGIMKQYGLQLGQLSTDYQSILLPILKSFMRSRLEDLVHKDAEKKSEAAMEKFMSELDAMEKINKGSHIRPIQEKSTNKKKKKKKKKEQIEAKDFKANVDIEQPLLPEEKEEQIDHPELEIIVSVIADELEQKKSKVLDEAPMLRMLSLAAVSITNVFGAGLKNEVNENNCFLNVIIQSLWHLGTFRNNFMCRSKLDHKHVGEPCVACALHDVFAALHEASKNYEEPINPMPLRIALSNLYAKHNLFKTEEMNDATEVLEVILWRLHQSFSSDSALLDFPSTSSCDDSSNPCVVHEIFGNSSEVVYIDADWLSKLKSTDENFSFNQIVKQKLEEIANITQRNSNSGNGRKLNHSNVSDWLPPHVIRIVLVLDAVANRQKDISETCNSLSTMLDIGSHSQGLDPGNKYILISMVCYHKSELHYRCFIYNHEQQRCVSYNDQFVEDIGNWDDVFKECIRSGFLPCLLIFETTNREDLSDKGTSKKSEAAKEAPSAQHALDTEKKKNEVLNNARPKEDKKKKKNKKKNKIFRKAKEYKATGDGDNFQLNQNDADQDKDRNFEIGDEEKLLEKNLEYQKNEHMVETIGENGEAGVSAIHSNHHEVDKEQRFQADVRKAVCLSLDCFEKQNGPLPSDVKDGTTPRLDVQRYVILQSMWRLRQLRDEFISRSEIPHKHNKDLCFLCAYRDSFTAIRIASRNEPEEAFVMTPGTPSRALPINQFMKELEKEKDRVNEDATNIGVPENAYELENQLAALVRNIAEEIEQERQSKKKGLNWGTL